MNASPLTALFWRGVGTLLRNELRRYFFHPWRIFSPPCFYS